MEPKSGLPRLLPTGKMLVPMAWTDSSGTLYDGTAEVDPGSDEFVAWEPFL